MAKRATLVPDLKSRVYGVIMELTPIQIEQMYSEPSVRAYRQEAVLVNLADGSQVPALCFNLPESSGKALPNSEYATKLRELGRRLRLPFVYVENIK